MSLFKQWNIVFTHAQRALEELEGDFSHVLPEPEDKSNSFVSRGFQSTC